MNPSRIRHRLISATCVSLILLTTSATSAAYAAGEPVDPNDIARVVEEAAARADTTSPSPSAPSDPMSSVTVPGTTEGQVVLAGTDGTTFVIPLPQDVDASPGVSTDSGTTVFVGREGHPDVTVEPLPDGARVSTVIDQTTSERSFDYRLPEKVEARPLADGRVELTEPVTDVPSESAQEVSVVVGYVEPAWAIDAAGREVRTDYEVRDGFLTQHVVTDEQTVYPVVADPQWSLTGWYQFRVRWNRAETATIASGGWAATGITAVCAAAGTAVGGPAGAAAAGATCLAITGSAVYTAGVAQNSRPRRCLELYMTYLPGIPPTWAPWFGTYSGGPCR